MNANVVYDYRQVFIDPEHGKMAPAFEMVNIDFTPTPSPFSPWPYRKIGTVTESLAKLHLKACPMMKGCRNKADDKLAECLATGAHDCQCPRWFSYLRSELKKTVKPIRTKEVPAASFKLPIIPLVVIPGTFNPAAFTLISTQEGL